MKLAEYKFEIMLIVIVVVLAIFWFAINSFDKKSDEFLPINDNTVERFTNNNSLQKPKLPNGSITEAMTTSNNNTEDNAAETENTNELEGNLSVSANNSTLTKTNDSVPSFNSLSLSQLSSLKTQTRAYGILGLVVYDENSDNLVIVSTKS